MGIPVALVLALTLAACATDAPDTPSPYPPTVKPALSKLVFTDEQTCEALGAEFERKQGWEAHAAKQVAVLHYELFPSAILMLGVNVLAFNRMKESLAETRGDLIAIRGEMLKDGCADIPEIVFSTPSARTPGSLYH
jgi:hypothetical protein